MSSTILKAEKLSRIYALGDSELKVLNEVSFEVKQGESLAITGPSGSGKSTLLGLCAGFDSPSSGEVELAGQTINALDEDQRSALRLSQSSFIFQAFHLMPTLTALENVMVPLELMGKADKEAKKNAEELLQSVGLGKRLDHYPSQLSGGEQQRVAIARAFINQPKILFADEPTGNLDNQTAEHIQELLFKLNEHHGTTLIIVTHDLELASKADRCLKMKDGQIQQ